MMELKDNEEKMVPSAEEKEKVEEIEEEEEEEEEEEDDLSGDEGEEEDGDDEDQESKDDEKKEAGETMPPAADEIEKNIPLPVKPSKKKQDEGLNLNNEVVKMRKEVKRVRALIIRKLTRQIAALKKKKGNEMAVERNQRRAARLKEEINAMKVLSPDLVTKTALQKKLNFEQECKNPKSTLSDRAMARIATHPQFNKKIEGIKAAVKAFKEERMKGGKQERNEKVLKKAVNVTQQTPDKKEEKKDEKEEEDITVEEKEIDNNGGDSILKDTTDVTVAEPEKDTGKATYLADTADGQTKEMPKNVRPASAKRNEIKDIVKDNPQSKGAKKTPDLKCAPEVLHKMKDEEESDLELSDDEEKEYFDDSTEERFHKQSSQSEGSDDDDDFFVGKVSKFKKRKKQKSVEEEKGPEVKVDPTDPVQSKLDELESRLKSKATSFQTVFCSSLSASKPGGGRGAGRGRGGDKFRGRGNTRGGRGLNRDFSKQSSLQKHEKEAESNSESKYSKSELSKKSFPFVGRGRGRGRGDVIRQNDRRGGGVFSHQAPQQALHPSWEASKKRKEQQGQILAFQGKKIKFDDD